MRVTEKETSRIQDGDKCPDVIQSQSITDESKMSLIAKGYRVDFFTLESTKRNDFEDVSTSQATETLGNIFKSFIDNI